MVIVTIFAVCFCLLQNLGIVGALVLFAVACLFSIYARRRGRTTNTEMMFDLIWGIVLPVLCLTFDPVLFSAGCQSRAFTIVALARPICSECVRVVRLSRSWFADDRTVGLDHVRPRARSNLPVLSREYFGSVLQLRSLPRCRFQSVRLRRP